MIHHSFYYNNDPVSVLQTEQPGKFVLAEVGADHAQSSGIIGTSRSDLIFSRNQIKMDPCPVRTRKHSFCTQYHAVFFRVRQRLHNMLHFFSRVLSRRLASPGSKDLIRIVIMMMVAASARFSMFMMVMLVFMVMMVLMAASAFLSVFMMMLVFMVMMVLMAASRIPPHVHDGDARVHGHDGAHVHAPLPEASVPARRYLPSLPGSGFL